MKISPWVWWVSLPLGFIMWLALFAEKDGKGIGVVDLIFDLLIFFVLCSLIDRFIQRNKIKNEHAPPGVSDEKEHIRQKMSGQKFEYFCSNCDTKVTEQSKFCSNCGKSFDKSECDKCGSQIEEDDKFFSSCGTAV